MTYRFLVAICVLTVLELSGAYALNRHVNSKRVDPAMVSDAGRARLLAMQIQAKAHGLVAHQSAAVRSQLRSEIRQRANEMRTILMRLEQDLRTARVDENLDSSLIHLQSQVVDYANRAEHLAAVPDAKVRTDMPAFGLLLAQADAVNNALEALVADLEHGHRDKLKQARSTQWGVIALRFLTLIALGALVFRPMERRLKQQVDRARGGEQYFRHLVENAYDVISLVDAEGRITYTSPSQSLITGHDRDYHVGRPAFEFMHPEDVTGVRESLATILSKPAIPISVAYRIVRPDGTVRHVESIAQNLLDDPTVQGIVVNSRDATEHKRIEEELVRHKESLEERVHERTRELEESNFRLFEEVEQRRRMEEKLSIRERRFRKLLKGVSDPIFMQDLGEQGTYATFSDVNDAACRVLGYSHDELLQLSPPDIVAGFVEAGSAVQDWMNEGDKSKVVEMQIRAKDGRHIPFECRLDLVEVGDREVILCLARDVTRRKAAETAIRRQNTDLERRVRDRTSELERRKAELEAANEELEAFAYSVSHDLRAPIRSLAGFSKILLEDTDALAMDSKTRHYLERIQANAARMGRLVDDLLAFSRVGRQAVRQTRCAPESLIMEVLRDVNGDLDKVPIEWTIDSLPPLRGDSALMKQVYQNLISNAIKYSRGSNPARIHIGCDKSGEEPVYFIRDNGVGFDMKYANKLFGVFQRLHRAEEYEGTGVGLAIVDRIVRKHGGRIWADSIPNEGATFYFTIHSDDHGEGG